MSDRIVITSEGVLDALRDGYTLSMQDGRIVGTRPQAGLTPRQKDAFDFICGYYDEHGYSPTYDEIAAALGLKAKSQAFRLVRQLIDRGYIEGWMRGRNRCLKPVRAS